MIKRIDGITDEKEGEIMEVEPLKAHPFMINREHQGTISPGELEVYPAAAKRL